MNIALAKGGLEVIAEGFEVTELPMQRFFTKSAGDLLPALRFLGGLHNFCNFVIIF